MTNHSINIIDRSITGDDYYRMLRSIEGMNLRNSFDKVWLDGYPVLITGHPQQPVLGSTLQLLESDLAGAFSWASQANFDIYCFATPPVTAVVSKIAAQYRQSNQKIAVVGGV
jgi:hypothetical protein